MKLRIGFVSNSSTSSFCIFGAKIDFDELAKKLGVEIPETFKIQGCWHSFDRRHKSACPQCGAATWKEVDFQGYIDDNGEEEAYSKLLSDQLKENGLDLYCYNDEYGDGPWTRVYVGRGPYGTGQELIDQLIKTNEACKKFFGEEATIHSGTYTC